MASPNSPSVQSNPFRRACWAHACPLLCARCALRGQVLDTDKSGVLSSHEFTAAMRKLVPMRRRGCGGGRRRRGRKTRDCDSSRRRPRTRTRRLVLRPVTCDYCEKVADRLRLFDTPSKKICSRNGMVSSLLRCFLF